MCVEAVQCNSCVCVCVSVCSYLHILLMVWSFLAGVVTFYCSLGPESLLPNVLLSIKPRIQVSPGVCFPDVFRDVHR